MTRLSAVGWRAFLVAALTIFVVPSAALATPTFLTPATISDPGQDGFEPQVASDGSGNAYAVWTRSDGTNFRIQYATRTPAGAWSVPPDPFRPGPGCVQPADLGRPERQRGRRVDPLGRHRSPHPGGLQGIRWLFRSSRHGVRRRRRCRSAPQVSMDNSGKALVAWTRFDGTKLRIQAAVRSAGAGGSFGAISTLSAGRPGRLRAPGLGGSRRGRQRRDLLDPVGRRGPDFQPAHPVLAAA